MILDSKVQRMRFEMQNTEIFQITNYRILKSVLIIIHAYYAIRKSLIISMIQLFE